MTPEFRSTRPDAARQRALIEEARAARADQHRALVAALEAGVECRAAQRTYFSQRSTTNLIRAKDAEARFDTLAALALADVPPRHPATGIGE